MKKFANQKLFISLLSLILIVGSFFIAPAAKADWAAEIVGSILGLFISALGVILVLVIQGLIYIAQYQGFINSEAVILGWVIVRDICNMFFVVILMIIAFGTILNIPDYSYKKWLPKLILFAILINFSKTICGLLIDVTQVVMLTFVNAFKDIGGPNLTQMLGITDIVTMKDGNGDSPSFWTVVGAYILGLVYLLIAIVVLVTMIMVLAMRMVMIWIYVVLSPAAYLLSAVPGGQGYASKWWDEFIKNLIVGPVLAFFIWLSLASLTADKTIQNMGSGADVSKEMAALQQNTDNTGSALPSKAGQPDALIKFVVGIGMLVGGLMVSQQIGGAAGGLAGKGMAKIQKGAAFAGGVATGAALLPLKGVKGLANYEVDKLQNKTGVDLNLKRVWAGVQNKRQEIKANQYAEGQGEARKAMEEGGRIHGVLAMTGNPGDAWEQSRTFKGIKQRLKGGKKMRQEREKLQPDIASVAQARNMAETKFNYAEASSENRNKMRTQAQEKLDAAMSGTFNERKNIQDIDNKIAREQALPENLQDAAKINNLKEEKKQSLSNLESHMAQEKIWREKRQYMEENTSKDYSDIERAELSSNLRAENDKANKLNSKVAANTPAYSSEARAAEQSAVNKEMSKVKDITDSSELLRILQGAIKSHDKTLVKAIALKMTKDGNDNEYLQAMTGRTDHVGLKSLMRQLSDKNSENYAGFSQQEAFGLGSQVSEINKDTNHWAATAGYVMENGQWRETTDREHNEIRDAETGKQQLQAFVRNNNRLAYGYHDINGTFHLDAGGIIKLKAIDNEFGHKNMDTMNESAAKHIYEAIKKDPKLIDEFSKATDSAGNSLISMLEKRLGSLAGHSSFDDKMNIATRLAK